MRFKNPQTAGGVLGAGTPLADQFLQIRVNGDLALFQALNRLLLDAEDAAPGTVLDRDVHRRSTRTASTTTRAHLRDARLGRRRRRRPA